MNRFKNIISIAAFSLLVMGLPAIASAQYGNGYPGGYGNGGYGNGGYNNGGYNNGRNGGYNDNRAIVSDLKNRTREFKNEVDRMYSSRGRSGGSILADIFGGWGNNSNGRYNDIRDETRQFKSAVDRLDNDGRGNSNEIRRALDEGADMDRAMSRLGNNGRNSGRGNGGYGNGGYNSYGSLQSQWQAIRSDLQRLSYSYSDNGRNGRGNWPF